ncbi:MAG: PIG-L family deacetylase [Pyrinomonadaceae bacterium]
MKLFKDHLNLLGGHPKVRTAVFLLLLTFVLPLAAQVRPVNDRGVLGLARLLRRINTTGSVMMIGAHPDDEDSALVAYLARGENARTAYLSLTRGDGGQNIIGSELFESLGIIRTEELLQARRLDGAEQYFARAFDYGFSKTLDEAKSKWDENIILCDAVKAIRLFRPQVIISRFSGTPADGHGQHQFAGYISPKAVKAAADAQQCREAGPVWAVLKFYVGQGFGDNAPPPTLRVNTGQFDPVLGRTYFEIAMEGRSQHRSQGEGRIEFHGEQFSGLNLVESRVERSESEKSIFDGIDTSITGIPKVVGLTLPELRTELAVIQRSAEAALRELRPAEPQPTISALARALEATRTTRAKLALILKDGTNIAQATDSYLKPKEAELSKALEFAAGITVDALADREIVVPGDRFTASVKAFAPATGVKVKDVVLNVPKGWTVTRSGAPRENTTGFNRREVAAGAAYFNISVPSTANPTQPYWLEEPRDGDLFHWQSPGNETLPFQPPPILSETRIDVIGVEITVTRPLQYRYADPARGEIRRDLSVVPAVSVSVDQQLLIVPRSAASQTRRLTVSVTNHSSRAVTGAVRLDIQGAKDWRYLPASGTLILRNRGEKTSVAFEVSIPANTETAKYTILPSVVAEDGAATHTMNVVAYPHIQTHRFYTRAETNVSVLDLKTAPVKVGYIMGSGDEVPAAIAQMGFDVQMLEEKDLAAGDLSKYGSIVVGIRASETRPDFVSNNQRLLDYVRNGGNLIVQYQRPSFAQQNLLPLPATMGPRVVDETAKVTILQPEHPIFNLPNKITESDFVGWVQERNLYNFNTSDSGYTALLESHDVGEPENRGGLVVAKLGKGTYVYCSYSFFRQLPAGVGGAYRLFANLLSLPASSLK